MAHDGKLCFYDSLYAYVVKQAEKLCIGYDEYEDRLYQRWCNKREILSVESSTPVDGGIRITPVV